MEYHADDYGLFPAQSARILECHASGMLNGISVMPNSEYLSECMAMLEPYRHQLELTIHLNLIEGRCLCPPDKVPLLADKQGVFRCSFGTLLLRSFLPGRTRCKQQLKRELRAQIQAVRQYMPEEAAIRLDGHAHYHMLPVVFDAMMEVIREDHLKVRYIRIPREHPGIYLRNWKNLHNLSPINLVKVLILNLLSTRNQLLYGDHLSHLAQKVFLGVFLSGHMDEKNVAAVLPDALRLAQSRGCGVELLAHPGGVYEQADVAALTNPNDIAFLTDPARWKEYEMLRSGTR